MAKIPSPLRFLILLLFLHAGPAPAQSVAEADPGALPPPAAKQVDFSRDIEPLFRDRCVVCHGSEKPMSGLRLDHREAALAGGYSGPAIQPGNSAGSRLIQLVAGLGKGPVMPLGGETLTAAQVGLLRAWIDQGATWPEPEAEQGEKKRGRTPNGPLGFSATPAPAASTSA